MMHPYLTLADGTQVVFSDLIPDEDERALPRVYVQFERPCDNGFDSVRFELPSYGYEIWEGSFTEDEMAFFKTFLSNNAHLLYAYAAEGGLRIA